MIAELFWLLLTIAFYGLLLGYLIILIPAAVLTGLKEKWAYFFSGFVTFGIAWIIGAFEILSPSRRQILIGAAAIVLIGFFAARPSVLVGVDGESLQSSVGSFSAFNNECIPNGDDWICWKYDDSISGDRRYLVSVNRLGCWEATVIKAPRERIGPFTDSRDSGCISLINQL